ncbi:hypothetical protein SDC9_159705 [bioreactor metagenome]|uniref:Uncharacterized protein n=1 Tax=bioreactor metagenome TaxID=1076179 RepID=A0A645FDJ2_9ZZZZ
MVLWIDSCLYMLKTIWAVVFIVIGRIVIIGVIVLTIHFYIDGTGIEFITDPFGSKSTPRRCGDIAPTGVNKNITIVVTIGNCRVPSSIN